MSGKDLHWFALNTIQVYNCANTEKKYVNENDIKVSCWRPFEARRIKAFKEQAETLYKDIQILNKIC